MSNKVYLEGSICEAHMIEEVSIFFSFYFEDDIPTPFNCTPQNDNDGPSRRPGCQSIFSHPNCGMPQKDNF